MSLDELSSGREPDRDPGPPRVPRLPTVSPSRWAAAHKGAAVAAAVVALLVLGAGRWAWDRAHPPTAAQGLRVQVDPSEYLLANHMDDGGQADVLLLLRVDVAAGLAGPVRLVGLSGGGITAAESHDVDGSSARFAVAAQVSCDQWADGRAVRAQFLVGPGTGSAVEVPLDAGRNSPVHAQITEPCLRYAATHPLRLTTFGTALESSAPQMQSTWSLVNRSGSPVTLLPGSDVTFVGGSAPLAATGDGDTPAVIPPHGTVSMIRRIQVTSCLHPGTLDASGTVVRLVGTTQSSADSPNTQVRLDLPPAFTAQVFAAATDLCRGAPDLVSARAFLQLQAGTHGVGRARVAVLGHVDRPGPWTVRLVSSAPTVGDSTPVTSQAQVQGPAPFSLAGPWSAQVCSEAASHPEAIAASVLVTVSGLRTYPYVLPVTISGGTSCTHP